MISSMAYTTGQPYLVRFFWLGTAPSCRPTLELTDQFQHSCCKPAAEDSQVRFVLVAGLELVPSWETSSWQKAWLHGCESNAALLQQLRVLHPHPLRGAKCECAAQHEAVPQKLQGQINLCDLRECTHYYALRHQQHSDGRRQLLDLSERTWSVWEPAISSLKALQGQGQSGHDPPPSGDADNAICIVAVRGDESPPTPS